MRISVSRGAEHVRYPWAERVLHPRRLQSVCHSSGVLLLSRNKLSYFGRGMLQTRKADGHA